MLPNKLKNTASEEIGNGVFFAYGAPYALLASFLSAIIYLVFLSKTLKKKYSQAMHMWPQMRKNVRTAICGTDVFSSLLRLRPNPRRTQKVFLSAVHQTAATRFFESLVLILFLCRQQLSLFEFY